MTRIPGNSYSPPWWIRGPHLQTLWGKLVRRTPSVGTRVERWATPDGDEVEIHRLDAPTDAPGNTPRLLLLHGLEGTIRSHYVRGMLAQAQRAAWAADVLIFRGCNGEVPRARRLYHSGETSDLDLVVRRLVASTPGQPLVMAGFSLGGNVLLKWLGEQGALAPPELRAAAVVSVPFDLERGSRHIERGFSRFYTRHFLRSLRRKAVAKLAVDPGLFDAAALARANTLFAFDDAVTAPVHGFAGASDYYARSSSIGYLSRIQRPTLLVSALDDPFLPREILERVRMLTRDNPWLHPEFHRGGGHVGFVGGTVPWRAHYYAEERVMQFLSDSLADHALTAHLAAS